MSTVEKTTTTTTFNGLTIKMTEKANARKLKWCLDNYSTLTINTQRRDQNGDKIDALPLLKKYYKKMNINDNTLNVTYEQTDEQKGRYFASQSISLQNIVREVRHTIAEEFYHDIDISNAHPNFLSWYCHKNGIACTEVDYFITNRLTYNTSLKETFKHDPEFDPKSFMLKLLNGGGKKTDIVKCENIIKNFYNEISLIHDEIVKKEPEKYKYVEKKLKSLKKSKHNIEGKTMNHLLCDIENQVLMIMIEYFSSLNIKTSVLVFDGCMIEKSTMPTDQSLAEILTNCGNYIREKTGINITLTCKEMDKAFKIPPDQLKNINMTLEDTFDELIENCIDGSHKEIATLLQRHYGSNIKVIDKEEMTFYHWNEKTLLWEKETKPSMLKLFDTLTPLFEEYMAKINKKIYKIRDDVPEDETANDERKDIVKNLKKHITKVKKVLNNLGNTPFLMNCIKYYSAFDINKEFEKHINRSSMYVLPIKDGHLINLETKEIRKRTKNDHFSFELTVEYKHTEEGHAKVLKFLNDISCNDKDLVDYHIKFWGYTLTGAIADRSFHILWGKGANGKSTLINIMKNIMGKYHCSLSETALLASDKQAGRATPELMNLLDARLAVLNETDEDKELNASRIKSLTGADTITARGLFQDEIQFKTQAKIIMLTNSLPSFNISDKAMTDRIKLLPFLATFDVTVENTKYIDDLTKNNLSDFFSVFVDGAHRYINGESLTPCTVMQKEMTNYVEELDNTNVFLSNFKIYSRREYDASSNDSKKNMFTRKSELLAMYTDWCHEHKEKPLKRNDFYKVCEKKIEMTPAKGGKGTEAFLLKRIYKDADEVEEE